MNEIVRFYPSSIIPAIIGPKGIFLYSVLSLTDLYTFVKSTDFITMQGRVSLQNLPERRKSGTPPDEPAWKM